MTSPPADDWVLRLPAELCTRAYRAGTEVAWPAEAAEKIIDWLTANGYRVLGIELWIPTVPGPTIPTPIWQWTLDQNSEEPLSSSNAGASRFVVEAAREYRQERPSDIEPYFNIEAE